MANYSPDGWVIVKINLDDEVLYKVFGSWAGGYLHGDAWRMSSGITRVEETSKGYIVQNHSGSLYNLKKIDENFLTGYNRNILDSWIKECSESGVKVEVVPIELILDKF